MAHSCFRQLLLVVVLTQIVHATSLQNSANDPSLSPQHHAGAMTSFLSVTEALSLGTTYSEDSQSYSTETSEDGGDPHCDANTPTCCFGLKCAFPNGICCPGSSSCCPYGAVCLPLTVGESQKCGHGLPESNLKAVFARPHTVRHKSATSSGRHCPCARSEEEREECACLRRRMLGCPCAQNEEEVDECACRHRRRASRCPCPDDDSDCSCDSTQSDDCGGESNCRPKVQPEIVSKDDLDSDGLQRPLIKGKDIDVPIRVLPPPPPPVNVTNSTPPVTPPPPPPPQNKTHVKTIDEIELEKLKQEEKDSEQDLKDLKRKLIQARKENDTAVLSDVNFLSNNIRDAEDRILKLHNKTLQREKVSEEREKVSQILLDRKLKAEKLEEEGTKRKEKIRSELEYKSQMKRLMDEQDKSDAAAAEARIKNLAEAERLHKNILEADTKAAEKFAGDTAAETSRAKAAAAEVAGAESNLKAEVQKMKATAAATKAKLDQAASNFTQNVQSEQQEKIDQRAKVYQEQTQKRQELEIANAIRKYRDSPS